MARVFIASCFALFPWRRALIGVLLIAVMADPIAGQAADASRLVIHVADAESGRPVPLARVSIAGTTQRFALTGRDGTVVFNDIAPGTFQGQIFKAAYKPTALRNVIVAGGQNVTIDATLTRNPRIIASVRSRSTVRPRATITDDGAQALVSGSLMDALPTDPFVNAVLSSGGTQPIGVGGHSPLQTSVSADGVPLAPFGALPSLRSLDGALFSEVNIQDSDRTGIDLRIPDPTLAATTMVSAAGYSTGGHSASVSAKGTAGYLGYSFGFSSRIMDGPLSGDDFLDESGLSYQHDDAAVSANSLLKLRLPFSISNAVTLSAINGQSRVSDDCDYLVGILPCGVGPGNSQRQNLQSWQLRDDIHSDAMSGSVAVFSSAISGGDKQLSRYIANLPQPLQSTYQGQVLGSSINVAPFTTKRLSWSYFLSEYLTQSRGQITAAQTATAPALRSSFVRAGATQTFTLSKRTRRTLTASYDSDGTNSSFETKAAFSWQLTAADTLNTFISAGALAPASWNSQGLSIPGSLTFDCVKGTAYGVAPGTPVSASNSSSAEVDYQHNGTQYWLDASALTQVVHNAAIPAFVSGQAVSDVTAPYLDSVNALFASPYGCGETSTLTPADMVFQENIAATARYSSFRARARFRLSDELIVAPYMDLEAATPTTSLNLSTLQAGRQILGVPLYKIGSTLDWQSHSKALEAALGLQTVAANNANFLPAYATVGAALRFSTPGGVLLVSATNVLGAYSDQFGSPALAAQISGLTARGFRPLGVPLPRASVRLAYRIWTAQTGTSFVPPPDDGNDAEAQVTISTAPLTEHGARDPYAIDTASQHCGPEQAGAVRSILTALRRAALSASGSHVVSLPGGETAYLRRAPDGSEAFLLAGTRASVIVAVLSCVQLHFGTTAQAASAKLYIPTDADPNFQIVFSPSYGFYETTEMVHATTHDGDTHPYTGSSKPYGFQLDPQSSACTADIRPAAEFMLEELKAYFSSAGNGTLDGMSVTRSENAYAIRFEDSLLWVSMRSCTPVYTLTARQLKSLNLPSAEAPQTLLYAPTIGIYEVAP